MTGRLAARAKCGKVIFNVKLWSRDGLAVTWCIGGWTHLLMLARIGPLPVAAAE